MKLINAYTVQPNKIESGDVALFIVKAMMVRQGVYRLYCCRYPATPGGDEIPQGSRMINEQEVCQALFPSLAMVASPDEHM
jgi:hypothetical protein